MSTRAHIRIYTNDDTLMYYHHSDGYPKGVGSELKSHINEIYKNPNLSEVIDLCYEETSCLHGDEEYIYIVDCRERTLKCYARRLNDTFDETIHAEREQIIPD